MTERGVVVARMLWEHVARVRISALRHFDIFMNAIEVKNLVKKYGGKTAVNGISFEIKKGEFFGFLGPNGAGKTTINSITGIGKFDAGEIKVFGLDVVRDYREARKKIGLSPQEFNMDFFRTVYKTLDFVGGYFGMRKPEREKRMEYLFSELGLVLIKIRSFALSPAGS